jgi:predicted MFS family arabinose efflux permease
VDRTSWHIVSAGVAAVGVSFGFARYGYGLLLPDIRAAYGLSSAALGAIATGSYAGYLVATAAAPVLAVRTGPRGTVALGLALAAVGMALIALTGSAAGLAVGVLVAGASAGLAFAPLSDAVARDVAPGARDRALAAISRGTGWGVALAVPLALLTWRTAWLAYAAIAMVVLVWSLRALPGRGGALPDLPRLRWSWFVCPRSGPLLIGSLVAGLGASAYWTFAVDHVVAEGGIAASTARLLLVVVGVAGVLGTVSADLVRRAGARASLGLSGAALAAALLLVGFAPGAWGLVLVSGLLFGTAYNVLIAVQVLWSAVVFAERPSAGLAGISFTLAVGMLAGPPLAGALAAPLGMDGVFALAAGLAAVAGLLSPRGRLELAPA